MSESRPPAANRARLAIVIGGTAVVVGYVAALIARHTIEIVEAHRFVPRWDLATHLGHGWLDYHLLVTGQLHRLVWDLWEQGYWPPGLSIYQIPFYALLGGDLGAGLWSALVAYVLVGLTACAVVWRQWPDRRAVLSSAFFVALLISSPFLMAYASVTMTEMLGAWVQLLVLLAHVHYRRAPAARAATLFAISLTLLFFTKYNYFFLIAVPLAIDEWLQRTAAMPSAQRALTAWTATRRLFSSPVAIVLTIYLIALVVISRTGGFEFHLLGQRVSVRTIGNSGHIVLYLLLLRLWLRHRRGRIDWDRVARLDPRVRPLLIWFVAPVVVWLASPYPNHLRDFANLVLNRPLGDATVGAGIRTYVDALLLLYVYQPWILIAIVGLFAVAAVRYRSQPPLMRCLIVTIPLQLAVIALHQTRFPRFLLLTVVLLFFAAAAEAGQWLARFRMTRIAGAILAPAAVALGVFAARDIVQSVRFRDVAFELYTQSDALRTTLDTVRAGLAPADRLAVVGQSNELAPAMFRWELGPPSGVACFPFELAGARGVDLDRATDVLLIRPLDANVQPLDATPFYGPQRAAVLEEANRGTLRLRRTLPVPDMHVAFDLYERPVAPPRPAPCR